MLGSFKLTSDRATFYPADSEQRFQGLENLNLERISLVVGENPDRLDWIVSGTITEYRGTNYLLVTKATLKNKSARQPVETPRQPPVSAETASSRRGQRDPATFLADYAPPRVGVLPGFAVTASRFP